MAHSCPPRHGPEPIDCAQLRERKHLGGVAQKPFRIPRRPAGPPGGGGIPSAIGPVTPAKRRSKSNDMRNTGVFPHVLCSEDMGALYNTSERAGWATKPSRRPNLTSLKQSNAQPQPKHNDTPSRLRTRLSTWTTTKYGLQI